MCSTQGMHHDIPVTRTAIYLRLNFRKVQCPPPHFHAQATMVKADSEKCIALSYLSRPAYLIAMRGINRDMQAAKKARSAARSDVHREIKAAISAKAEDLGRRLTALLKAGKRWTRIQTELEAGQYYNLMEARKFAQDFGQPLAELWLQEDQIRRKWSERRATLKCLEAGEHAIQLAYSERIAALEDAEWQKIIEWAALLAPLMPENATFHGALNAWSREHRPPRGTDDDQMAEGLARAFRSGLA